MAVGDFEASLPRKLTRKLAAYSSSWWDMRHAAQMLYSRSTLGQEPAHYFARRGLLDGAVITYARCFADGRRTPHADIRSLLVTLTPKLRDTHETVMWWRNKHVGHRVDQNLEQVDVNLLWGNFKTHASTVQTRVRTRIRPDGDGFEANFEKLAAKLATRIWEKHLYPLQQELFVELGPEGVVRLAAAAIPSSQPETAPGEILVTMNIGAKPSSRQVMLD
jgi:hypothetical protein